MKVFVDTNVLVAAYATRGLCSDLLRLILAQHELVVSRQVLAELERALRDKIGLPEALIAEILATLTPQLCRSRASTCAPPSCCAMPGTSRSSPQPSRRARRRSSPATPTSSTPRPDAPLPILSPRAFWLSCAAAEA